MKKALVAVLALPVAVASHALAGVWTLLTTCGVSDVAQISPAPASRQGRICDAEDHWLNVVPWVVLGLGVVLAVVLAVRLLSSRWRWVGLTACLWLPLVAYAVLRVPPDTCTEAQARDLPPYSCDRYGGIVPPGATGDHFGL